MITTERVYQGLIVGACGLALIAANMHVRDADIIQALEQRVSQQQAKITAMEQNIQRMIGEADSLTSHCDSLLAEIERLEAEISAYEHVDLAYAGEFYCTAYCCEPYAHVCGTGSGITASGAPVTAGVSIALSRADLPRMPFGTAVYIEGVGVRIVQDTGSMSAGHIDVAVPTHSEASAWSGQGNRKVFIINF